MPFLLEKCQELVVHKWQTTSLKHKYENENRTLHGYLNSI